jgi:hypothetical protein
MVGSMNPRTVKIHDLAWIVWSHRSSLNSDGCCAPARSSAQCSLPRRHGSLSFSWDGLGRPVAAGPCRQARRWFSRKPWQAERPLFAQGTATPLCEGDAAASSLHSPPCKREANRKAQQRRITWVRQIQHAANRSPIISFIGIYRLPIPPSETRSTFARDHPKPYIALVMLACILGVRVKMYGMAWHGID